MSENAFVGARLRVARTLAGQTLAELGIIVAASASALSDYETGEAKRPSASLVAALAQALRVKPGFFFLPLADEWQERECSCRRGRATSKGARKRARAHGTLVSAIAEELQHHCRVPLLNAPSISATSEAQIEQAAETCRELWGLGLGPISHVGRVAERNGMLLIRHLSHDARIDAFSRRGATASVIVLNTAKESTSRQIFDVAHEIGHFALHKDIETGSKETEDQANMFASAFLLPKRTFAIEFRSKPREWAAVFDLKQRWKASASAIVHRAHSLGLLDPISYRRFYQYMSVKGWLKKEPYEPEFAGPEWLKSAFNEVDPVV